MKVAIYCRVSKREQNPENQRLQLEEYAKRMNYDYEVFTETESTRKTRPVKQDLMNRLRQKDFDGILVLKLDRFARSLSELVIDVKELIDKGVAFISLRDNLDLSSATGKLQFHILAAFAEFEREIIRERTLDGLERAKANGSCLGRPKGAKDKKKRRKSGYHLRYASNGKEKQT
jgi:DNA invertase Pin-like site-specific DNA recombinase